MTALRLALALWARDVIISLVAFAGWPAWPWAHRYVDHLEAAAEALREKQGVRS